MPFAGACVTASALLPFRAVRFDDGLPAGLAAVIGPPADIESSERALAFVADRPYSAVRLELSDDPHGARFLGARRIYDQWMRDGILKQDDQASFYVYEQEFVERGITRMRRGIFGLVELDAPETIVLPHEDTWEENLRRRRHILRDIEASLSPVLLLHDAPSQVLEPAFSAITALEPNGAGFDDDGQLHRLWVVQDPEVNALIARAMTNRRFMIADGHHRFASARAHHRAHLSPATGLVPALCIAEDDPGLAMRAIHRLLVDPLPADHASLLSRLHTWFDVSLHPGQRRSATEILTLLGEGPLPVFAIVFPDERVYRVELRSTVDVSSYVSRRRPALRRLDVTVATDVLLQQGFDVDPTSSNIAYSNDTELVLSQVRSGAVGAGILLRPPTIGQVLTVAESHGRMPQKSTSFVPKVPVGLVMYDFHDDRDVAGHADLT